MELKQTVVERLQEMIDLETGIGFEQLCVPQTGHLHIGADQHGAMPIGHFAHRRAGQMALAPGDGLL